MIEPNCDMPWEIYLDWLQDQGNEELRGIEMSLIPTSAFILNIEIEGKSLSGEGDIATA